MQRDFKEIIADFLLDYMNHDSNKENYTYYYNKIHAHICSIAYAIREEELKGRTKEEIYQDMKEVRKILHEVPFMARTQDWPRGYQGDFETIEHLYWGINKAPYNSFVYFIEEFALRSPTAQQHRNKVEYQAKLILDTILSNDKTNILSIGCGSCLDVRSIQKHIQHKDFSLVLNDLDLDALEFSIKELQLIKDKCTLVNENIIRSQKVRHLAPYDLIITGGVFDYLNDKTIKLLLRNFRENLMKEDGRFFFTNIKRENPLRTEIEYLGNWNLIERDKEDIIGICLDSGFNLDQILISQDNTQFTFLVELTLKK